MHEDTSKRPPPEEQAEQRVKEILRAAASWAREAPKALEPYMEIGRASCRERV